MRPVKIFKYEWVKDAGNQKIENGTGTFLAWGIDYEEFSSSDPMQITVAVVERDNGEVNLVRTDLIQFTDKPGEACSK